VSVLRLGPGRILHEVDDDGVGEEDEGREERRLEDDEGVVGGSDEGEESGGDAEGGLDFRKES